MKTIEKRKLVRQILLQPKFMRMQQLSMAVDYRLDKDRKESRYTHSIEVANACEIMNDCISNHIGFNTDYKNLSYIIGLLHDIGHTAFCHEGEEALNSVIKKISPKLSFDSNSNNYIVIEKNGLLNGVPESDLNYILASLAKHPSKLYPEQSKIVEIISEELISERLYLSKASNNLIKLESSKTIQCQIMDISDENCYIISDIIDSLNILSKSRLASIFSLEFDTKVSRKFNEAIFKSKKDFVNVMQEYFFLFCNNFTLSNSGRVIAIDMELDNIRKTLAKINNLYVLKFKLIKNVRKRNSNISKSVFEFFLIDNKNLDLIPSSFYRNELSKKISIIEKYTLIRDMLGSLTDKGIKNLYKKIS